MKFKVSFILFILFSQVVFSQDSSIEYFQSLQQLGFMEGKWLGEGWIIGKDRKKHRFSQSEIIQSKVNGAALMVDGLGNEIDSTGAITDKVIHRAFGVISYNRTREKVTMISFSEINGRMESDFVRLGEKKIQWSFNEPKSGAVIRFTEDFSKEGIWYEVGEISMNNQDWYQFFEMNLTKK